MEVDSLSHRIVNIQNTYCNTSHVGLRERLYNENEILFQRLEEIFYLAKFFASDVAQRRCISLECGLQNGTLAVFVGTQLFGDNMTYMVPTAAYALIMMTTSVIFVLILRRQT